MGINMSQIFLLTSFKGGVGKSTLAANLALKLARLPSRVLLCDLDFDLRTLDLLTGCEDRLLFDVCDVVYGRKALFEAALPFGCADGLYFLGAPYKCRDTIDKEAFAKRLKELSEGFDYVLLDTPGGDTITFEAAALCSDCAFVVATQAPASLRGAERTASALSERGLSSLLIINSFDSQSVLDDRRAGILSVIDTTKVSLLGVVPYDRALSFAQEKGVLADGELFSSSRAFENIAKRIAARQTGERNIPILYGVRGVKRKKLLTK